MTFPNKISGIAVLAIIVMVAACSTPPPVTDEIPAEIQSETETNVMSNVETDGEVSVHPIEHATAVLKWGDKTIYLDPTGGADLFASYDDADLVLVTDMHGDHFDPDTLAGVVKEDTLFVVPQAVMDELPKNLTEKATVLANNGEISDFVPTIKAMPMYNLPEAPDAFHVKGRGNGYLLTANGYTIYIAGDTAGIPEMRALKDINMAFVPMNLPYTMDIKEAADAVLEFAPAKVLPYHFRGQPDFSDVEEFKRLVDAGGKDIEVVLLDWYHKN